MGRKKHCTSEQRKIILKMLQQGRTYKFIQNILQCSAKMIVNAKKFVVGKENRGGKRKTTPTQDRRLLRLITQKPFLTSTELKKELDLPIRTSAIRRKLIAANLKSRTPRRVPLLYKRQVSKRLTFAKDHVN